MRYFIEIAYNGTHYFGWQMQPNAITVQEVLEQTMSTFLRKEIKVVGAGRTDAGVHARQLFAHFDTDKLEDVETIVFKLNKFLPKDISVKNIIAVDDEAHARFDAISREYEYKISVEKDPFLHELQYEIHTVPDVELMNKGAALLLGYTDFQCFSRSNTDVKTYNCVLKKAIWTLNGSTLVFTIKADRFLRNMVRAIVGTLLDLGYGRITEEQLKEIVASKDRRQAGSSAPAHGLYLTKIEYPKHIFK